MFCGFLDALRHSRRLHFGMTGAVSIHRDTTLQIYKTEKLDSLLQGNDPPQAGRNGTAHLFIAGIAHLVGDILQMRFLLAIASVIMYKIAGSKDDSSTS